MSLVPRSFGDEEPSGPNLEYDPEYIALEGLTTPAGDTQFGVPKGKSLEPKYDEIIEKAEEILDRSHDLRAAIWLAEARARTRGIESLAEVTRFIRLCLEEFWASCYPQLDPDDDDDPSMRINAVLGLAASDGLPAALRLVPLAESPAIGRFNLREILISTGEIDLGEDHDGDPPADPATIEAAFRSTSPDLLQAKLAAARAVLDDLGAIDAVFDAQTPGQGPSLDALTGVVRRIVRELSNAVGEPEAEAAGGDDAAAAGPVAGVGGGAVGGVPGAIASRRDAEIALDKIIVFFETTEPSSPLPIVLRRARRLVGADFLTIMKDLAPAGLDNVRLVGGIEDEDGY